VLMETLEQLRQRAGQAVAGGGPKRVERQHAQGKLTARERLDILLDAGSFYELDRFATTNGQGLLGDGVVVGLGTIDGRQVCVAAQDFTVLGGSIGLAHGRKVCKGIDLALQGGFPIIALNDSGGARIQEGVDALAAVGEIFYRTVNASGVVPQISVMLGPCAGGAAYTPALTDFVVMVEGISHVFITGPDVVRAVTREEVSADDLGGAHTHASASGVAHFAAPDEESALALTRRLLSYLPSNNMVDPPLQRPVQPSVRPVEGLGSLVPGEPNVPYDVRQVIEGIVDGDSFLEIQATFAPNMVIGLARLNGQPVGVVANQPQVLAGVLDIDASDKGARFVRFCDAFNLPLVTFVDTPGFMPGLNQERGGIIRHGAKLIYAYTEATVPKLAVILRKAYGGAYLVMSSKHLRSDINLAWPGAELAVMGPEGAVPLIYRKELTCATDPQARLMELVTDYRGRFAQPYVAAARGYLDDVIEPEETRQRLVAGLYFLDRKRGDRPKRKHGNLPL
jgi:acetyl-CoA carboxylase carboxyltransferase component